MVRDSAVFTMESLQETAIALSNDTIDDPLQPPPYPKMGSQMHTSCYVEFRMAMSPQRVIRSTSCLVLGRVFGVSGSNGAISGCIKPKMAAMTRHDSKYRQEPSDDAFCQITLAPCVGAKNGTVFVEPLNFVEY